MGLKYYTVIFVPHARARFRKWRVTNRQLHIVPHEPPQQSVDAAAPRELLEDQMHDRLHLLVRIDHVVASAVSG